MRLGMTVADVRRDHAIAPITLNRTRHLVRQRASFRRSEAKALQDLEGDGFDPKQSPWDAYVDARYPGQVL